MCKLQEPPFEMSEPAMNIVVSQSVEDIHVLGEKKSKKQKKTHTAGIEVIETLEEAPVKQINPEEQQVGYTPQEIDTIVQTANQFSFPYEKLKTGPMPGPCLKGQTEYLPTYEEMMFQDMLECGPRSMETQPDLDMPEEPEPLPEYLMDASKPLHTSFVLHPFLSNQGNKSTCPVYFGSGENKQKVLNAICDEMHT